MMTPPPRWRLPDVVWTPYSDQGMDLATPAAPASGSWGATTTLRLYPLSLLEPFTVAKAFVCNGATVGTDSWDIGVYKMTDMSTGRLDLIRSTGAILSAGTANAVAETATWKVARANITANSDSTDSATYTTASITLKAGRLYIAAIENSHGTSASAVSAITGGPTFSAAPATSTTLYNSNLNRISLWTAVPTVDYTGTLTIAFGGTTQTGCVWAINELSGVDTTTNNGIVQSAVGTGTSTTPLATLAAFGSANNATFAAHGVVNTSGFTPGTGFTELSDTTAATPAQGMETEWRVDNDTTADATVTSGAWGSVAVEIKADAGSFIIPPSTPGNPDIYMGMTVTGVTATFLRVSATAGLLQSAGHIGISGTQVCLPSSGTASAVTTGVVALPLAGFSSRTLLA